MRKIVLLAIAITAMWFPSQAFAINIDSGPDYNPPGAGFEFISGDATALGGATVSYSGIDLSETDELYYGVRNDVFANAFSSDGLTITAGEVFRLSSFTANTIVYTGETIFESTLPDTPGVWNVPTRITYTFSGTGTTIVDGDTVLLNNSNGDVTALWHVQDSSFSVHVLIEVQVPINTDFNFGNWEPAHFMVNRFTSIPATGGTHTATSYDLAFYHDVVNAPKVPSLGIWGMGALALGLLAGARRRLAGSAG